MSLLAEQLALPFQFPFMVNAFAVTLCIGIPMALISAFLVLKGWSLMGDAISHAVLPGIVLAYMLNLPLTVGAFCAGMVCALATGYLTSNSRIKEDTVMGVVFSGMFGLGIVLYVSVRTNVHLDHILFGDMLGITRRDIVDALVISAILMGFLFFKWRDLLAFSFDGQHARAIGLPVTFLHYGLLAAISLAVVAALKAVGIILSVALLVTPGATAFLLVNRFSHMLVGSVMVAAVSILGGIYLSFFIDSAPAPTIVLLMTLTFLAALARSLLLAAKRSRKTIEERI
ncbi:MAG: metal ABC transporter permease [Rhizobiaceae bacterium]